MLTMPLMILFGLLTINVNAEQHNATNEIGPENNNSDWLSIEISKESDDNLNVYPSPTIKSDSKIVQIEVNTSESNHEKSQGKTRSDSHVNLPNDSDLHQETEFDKHVNVMSEDSDPVISNTKSVVTIKRSDIETDHTENTRRLNSGTDSETEKSPKLNGTDITNIDTKIQGKSNNSSESGNTLSDLHLAPNSEKSQVYRMNHSDNVSKPLDNEENRNDTEFTKSKDTDDNISITDTRSDLHLASNTKKSQVYRRSHTDNVSPLDNEENHNETESKKSKNAVDNNSTTEASKSKVNNGIDETYERDTLKDGRNTQGNANNNNKQSEKAKAKSSNVTEIDSKEVVENNKDAQIANAAFTRRSLNYDDSKNFNKTAAEIKYQSTTTEQKSNYDNEKLDNSTNLNYDSELSDKDTANEAKSNDNEEFDYSFGSTRRNINQEKLDGSTFVDTVQPIETAINTENVRTVLSRSGRPDYGYMDEPYDLSIVPNLVKLLPKADVKPMILKPCYVSPQNYRTTNSFIIHPVYRKLSRNGLRKSVQIIPNLNKYIENERDHHPLFPNIKTLRNLNHYKNHGNLEALNIFPNQANTITNPGTHVDHYNKITKPLNHRNVFSNSKNQLNSYENLLAYQETPVPYYGKTIENHENPLINHGNNYAKHESLPMSYENYFSNLKNPLNYNNPPVFHENSLTPDDPLINHGNPINNYANHEKYLANQPDFRHHESFRKGIEEIDYLDQNVYPRAVAIHNNQQAEYENPPKNYGNPLKSHDPLIKQENPFATHKNPLSIHENPIPLHRDPFTNHGNPSASNGNNNAIHENLYAINGKNLANQPESTPFYNNFHKPFLSGDVKQYDNNHLYQATGSVSQQKIAVPFSQESVKPKPYRKAGLKFPVKPVPFQSFFL